MRLLLVEDDEELREIIAAELVGAGHEVRSAADGAQAWTALEQGDTPDVILLDLDLPGMDGRALRRRQLQDARLARVPTIVITEAVDDTTRGTPRSSVPRKPFAVEMLFEALRAISEQRQTIKICGCGRLYDEVAWRSLRVVGFSDNGRQAGERVEMRLCACGSTLARPVGAHAISMQIPRTRAP